MTILLNEFIEATYNLNCEGIYKLIHKCNLRNESCNLFKKLLLKHLLFFLLLLSIEAKAQKIDSIYVHLYTDSLKKGTYNYINIDGKLSNGRFIPLDTADIRFSSSEGKFSANSLWIDPGFKKEKVSIKATLKSNPLIYKEFTIYIKKKPDDEKLKTLDDLMNEPGTNSKHSRKRKS
jgi:hypothetical protein